MAVTIIDVSSDDNPANRTKSCSVTVTPVRTGNSLDLTSTESGDCSTVAIEVAIDLGVNLPGDGGWVQYTPSGEKTPAPVGLGEGGATSRFGCDFDTESDDPHISSTGEHVSVHGWWDDNFDDSCPYRATVTVWLKAFYCWNEALNWCAWITVGYNSHDVRAYNRSNDRVNARDYCNPATSYTSYQGIVDVEVIGQWDWSDKHYSPIREFLCNPS